MQVDIRRKIFTIVFCDDISGFNEISPWKNVFLSPFSNWPIQYQESGLKRTLVSFSIRNFFPILIGPDIIFEKMKVNKWIKIFCPWNILRDVYVIQTNLYHFHCRNYTANIIFAIILIHLATSENTNFYWETKFKLFHINYCSCVNLLVAWNIEYRI